MKPVIPDDLIAQVARQNCVAFVGAGLSAAVGLPGWPRLIRQMIDWCESHGISLPNKADIERLLEVKNNLLDAADALRSNMGDGKYRQFLEEVFLRPDLKPTEVHKILVKIPFAGVGTTNYDPLIEEAYREVHPDAPFSVFTQVDYEQLGTALHAKRFFVLKAHGTIERPETIVLGRKDYNRLIHGSEDYRTFLRALFLQKTVLFLGFSMTDPELLLLLGELNEIFQGNTPTHYALMDVSDTTQTEQDQFKDYYGVRIIPYTPSAADHPEVKAFLLELSERVTQQAIWYQMEEARKAVDDTDPHYQAVFTTDGSFIIKERHPGASEEQPLTLSITVNRAGHEAIKRTQATGEPLNLREEDIIDVKVPDIISRHIRITGHLGITSGVARGEKTLTVKAVVECADGETASLDNVILENIQGGSEQMILSNENQDVPWKFRQIVKFDEDYSHLTYTLEPTGASIKRALEGFRFSRALSKGGRFHYENVETGVQFAPAEFPPGVIPSPDPLLIRALEALEFIQKKTGVLFTMPQNFTRAEAENILNVEQILRTGKVELQPPSFTYTDPEEAKNDLERFSHGATLSLTQYSEDWVFIILGKGVFLGPVLVSCGKMVPHPEDMETLRKAVEDDISEAHPIVARLVPVPGLTLEAKLLRWLPAEEAEEFRKHPYVRTASLNHFIKMLFDAAKYEAGSFDVGSFIGLLEEADKQKSDKGITLSPLEFATPDGVLAAFEPLLAELKPEDKVKIAVELFKKDFLPSGEAARLSGLDESSFTEELSRLDEDKTRHAGSDA